MNQTLCLYGILVLKYCIQTPSASRVKFTPVQRAARSLWTLPSFKNDWNDALCWPYAERWISHSVDPQWTGAGAAWRSYQPGNSVLLLMRFSWDSFWDRVSVRPHWALLWLLTKASNKELIWAVLSGNKKSCKTSLIYFSKSVNMVNRDNNNISLIEMNRKAWKEMWMWHRGPWFSDGRLVRLIVGLDELECLFQLTWVDDKRCVRVYICMYVYMYIYTHKGVWISRITECIVMGLIWCLIDKSSLCSFVLFGILLIFCSLAAIF